MNYKTTVEGMISKVLIILIKQSTIFSISGCLQYRYQRQAANNDVISTFLSDIVKTLAERLHHTPRLHPEIIFIQPS